MSRYAWPPPKKKRCTLISLSPDFTWAKQNALLDLETLEIGNFVSFFSPNTLCFVRNAARKSRIFQWNKKKELHTAAAAAAAGGHSLYHMELSVVELSGTTTGKEVSFPLKCRRWALGTLLQEALQFVSSLQQSTFLKDHYGRHNEGAWLKTSHRLCSGENYSMFGWAEIQGFSTV